MDRLPVGVGETWPKITLSDFTRACSHPLRRRILRALTKQPASPVTLAAVFEAPLGHVSYHVRALRAMGLIELLEMRQVRGALEHIYQARPGVLAALVALDRAESALSDTDDQEGG